VSCVINPYMFARRFWTNLSSTTGKVITGFNSTFTGSTTVNWGDGTTTPLTSGVNVNKTFVAHPFVEVCSSGVNVENGQVIIGPCYIIDLITSGVVTQINCGTSSPKLGGTVDISAFPSLTSFTCNSNHITALSGYAQNSNLTFVRFLDNKVTGSIPSLDAMTNLQTFSCGRNRLTGSIPSLSELTNLQTFSCGNQAEPRLTGPIPSLSGLTNLQTFDCSINRHTGSIPSLSGLTNLQTFNCYENQLTGPIPSLSGLTNLQIFYCYDQQGLTKLTGSIPSLSGLTNLIDFRCYTNQLTGPIPSLSGLTLLQDFRCHTNQLTGSIPSLSGLNNLQEFRCSTNELTGPIPSLSGFTKLRVFVCHENQLTGSIPSLSGLTNLQIFYCYENQLTGFAGGSVSNTLGNFQAQTNQLNQSSVNAILSAFVVANRTAGTRILNLGGTGNFGPTGQGLTDFAILTGRGWIVTTGTRV